MLHPVILSGGVGSRLWPLSREHYPKQLLALTETHTLIQATVRRLSGLAQLAPTLVVCNEDHRFLVAEQLRPLDHAVRIVLEPVGRNTAPAVALAALLAQQQDPNALLLVLPADHLIQDQAAFQQAIAKAVQLAEQDKLATFGIVAKRPETGYGYIQAGAALSVAGTYQVAGFVEKPNADTAAAYVSSGQYYWNSGMFLFKARRYLEELALFAPEILRACQAAIADCTLDRGGDFLRVDPPSFSSSPAISIDYAVMEKTQAAAMVPLDAGWNDIGSWSSLWEVGAQDAQGNVVQGDVLLEGVNNSYLRAEYRLLAAIGLDDLIVVETADAVLVAHRDQVQAVKTIVNRLKHTERREADLHRKVYRPWGTYETMDSELRFQVKRIMVNPGASLSLQMHHHRSEHWIVVKGTALVHRDGESCLLSENQSTYIPLGVKHRLENPGKIPLEIIEVQSGTYLGEDDIVRFDDHYGRVEPAA